MRISDWSSDVCSSDLSDEILGGIPAECGFGEMRIGGKIAIRRSMQIGEIAAPTTSNAHLFPGLVREFAQQDFTAPLPGDRSAHYPGCDSPQPDHSSFSVQSENGHRGRNVSGSTFRSRR